MDNATEIQRNDRVRLDGLTPQQLVTEIRQLIAQYSAEVSTKRRTWPKSIHDRALALHRLGVSRYKMAGLTGIPYNTVITWCGPPRRSRVKSKSPAGAFLPVLRSASSREAPPTVGPPTVVPPTVGGLTVVLPGGIEVRGLRSIEQVAELHRALGASR